MKLQREYVKDLAREAEANRRVYEQKKKAEREEQKRKAAEEQELMKEAEKVAAKVIEKEIKKCFKVYGI